MSKELGRKLKFLRSRIGFTQSQISDQINVDRSTYSNYERAVTEPDVETLIKLAKIFGVDANELLSGDETVPRVADAGTTPIYSLTKEEKEFIVRFRLLNGEQKQEIFESMEGFSSSEK